MQRGGNVISLVLICTGPARERPDALHLKPHIIPRTMPTEVDDLFTLGCRDGNTRTLS